MAPESPLTTAHDLAGLDVEANTPVNGLPIGFGLGPALFFPPTIKVMLQPLKQLGADGVFNGQHTISPKLINLRFVQRCKC